MKRIFFLAVALTLGFTTLTAQKAFQGTIEYAFQMEGENIEMMSFMFPEKMVVVYGDQSMMTYFEGGIMSTMIGKVVINGTTNEVFMRKDEEEAIYVMGPEDLEGNEQQAPESVTKEKEQETIAGYKCQKYRMVLKNEGKESIQYIWTTEKLKAPELNQKGFEGFGSSMITNQYVPGFPLKVVNEEPESGITVTLTATIVQDTPVEKTTFDRPEGYEVKAFDAKMFGGN